MALIMLLSQVLYRTCKRREMTGQDKKFMQMAIEKAAASESEDPEDPKVGAVVVKGKQLLDSAHRGETGKGHHAEFALLQKKLKSIDLLKGATLYTTLEPCTARSHDKLPCAGWIVRKRIKRVVIGMLDPNPNICGRGYWQLLDAGLQVEFFPHRLVGEIMQLNNSFIQRCRAGVKYDLGFISWVTRNKSSIITPYIGTGWGDALSLQDCPKIREGWPMSQIELRHDNRTWLLPERYKGPFEKYYRENYEAKRFFDDREKFMLIRNPVAFFDSPTLKLEITSTRYSCHQYYLNNVAIIASERGPLIQQLINGSLEVQFAHTLCMHMVIVTSNNKMLITRRSPKVAYHPNTWSCSVEESLACEDLKEGPSKAVLNWGKRLLWEELGLDTETFSADDLRVLSVFLESDSLNISLCAYVELKLSSDELDIILRGKPRTDYEFTEWDFEDFEEKKLLRELNQPKRSYHPTSGYRMLMALLKRYGVPSRTEV